MALLFSLKLEEPPSTLGDTLSFPTKTSYSSGRSLWEGPHYQHWRTHVLQPAGRFETSRGEVLKGYGADMIIISARTDEVLTIRAYSDQDAEASIWFFTNVTSVTTEVKSSTNSHWSREILHLKL